MKGYCFIMTVPDPIEPEQPRRKLKNYSGNFLNIRLTARTWPPLTQPFDPLKTRLGGKYFADDE
jgi:hypothetical protein